MKLYIPPEAGHPVDLIWRDWGMLDFLITREKKFALRSLKRSKKYLTQMPENSNIVKWLDILLNLHVEFVKGKTSTIKDNDVLKSVLVETQLGELVSIKNYPQDQKDLLRLFRHNSPY